MFKGLLTRRHLAVLLAEFLGTATLAVAVYGVVSVIPISLFAGMAAGLVLGLSVLSIGAVSGAHINPAITVGLWTIGKIKTLPAIAYIVAQVLGGFAALYLIKYFAGQPMESIAGKFEWKAFTAEAVGAFVFGFGVAAAVYQKYEGGKLATAFGVSLLLGVLVASSATLGVNQLTQQPIKSNGVINPAVAISLKSFNWAYAAGPIVGAAVGMNMYTLVFTDTMVFKRTAKIRKPSKVSSVSTAKTASTKKKKAAPKKRK